MVSSRQSTRSTLASNCAVQEEKKLEGGRSRAVERREFFSQVCSCSVLSRSRSFLFQSLGFGGSLVVQHAHTHLYQRSEISITLMGSNGDEKETQKRGRETMPQLKDLTDHLGPEAGSTQSR